ncbi:Anthranilate phosphoribosyltransferase, partial [termite gut metagenome]
TGNNEKIYMPEDLGFARYKEIDLYGGDTPEEAARIFDDVMNNQATQAQMDVVTVNAGFAIHVICLEKGIEECIAIAKESLESGKAKEALKKFLKING